MYWKNKLIHFIVFASVYMNIEVFDRALVGNMIGVLGISKWSLMGYTSIYMGILGGFLATIIAFLCDNPKYFILKAYQKVILGGLIITLGELLTGIILNIWLKLAIWSYTADKLNFLGQIELKNSLLWMFVITPLVIWLDSHLTYYIYKEDKPISLIKFYKEVLTLK